MLPRGLDAVRTARSEPYGSGHEEACNLVRGGSDAGGGRVSRGRRGGGQAAARCESEAAAHAADAAADRCQGAPKDAAKTASAMSRSRAPPPLRPLRAPPAPCTLGTRPP